MYLSGTLRQPAVRPGSVIPISGAAGLPTRPSWPWLWATAPPVMPVWSGPFGPFPWASPPSSCSSMVSGPVPSAAATSSWPWALGAGLPGLGGLDHGSHFFWPGRARGLVLPFPHREDDHSLRPVPPGRLVAGPGTAPARLARRLAMVRRNGFISLTGLMLALGLLLLYLGLGLTAGQRSRSHQPSMAWRGKWPWICSRSASAVSATTRATATGNWSWKKSATSSRKATSGSKNGPIRRACR